MRGKFLILFVPSLLCAISAPSAENLEPSAERKIYAVSMVSLLATPRKFEGKTIRVGGYLRFTGSLRLFLSREHADMSDALSSVVVVDSTDGGKIIRSCSDKYAYVEGEFRRDKLGAWSITGTRSVHDVDNMQYCWSDKK